jgi:hypothetical protein
MPLADHDVRESNLLACLLVDKRRIGDAIIGRERAISLWRSLITNRCFVGKAVHASPPISGRSIVAFGCSVFVSSEFTRAELRDPRPCLNDRFFAHLNAGDPVLLSEKELRYANARGDLCLLILYSNWIERALTGTQILEIGNLFAQRWYEAYHGYRFDTLISEEVGADMQAFRKATGVWRLVKEFEGEHRGFTVLTRNDALSVTGSIAAKLFLAPSPKLKLRPEDQELLIAALDGATDEEVAEKLRLTVATVKKRWRAIGERVEKTLPDLLPEKSNPCVGPTRGPQRKHRLLAYMRQHPEELRPFEHSACTPI